MILTYDGIKAANASGDIKIDPFDDGQLQAASYDLRVGRQGATTKSKRVVDIAEAGYLLLQPGDLGVVVSLERLHLGPQYAARFGLRSKYARKGLFATTGPQIDPGFRGRLFIGVMNLTPKAISLPYNDDFLSVEFHKLEQPTSHPYDGPYQDRDELGPEEISFIMEAEGMALSDMMTTLQTLSRDVGALSTTMRYVLWGVPLVMLFGIAVIAVIVEVGLRAAH